MAPRYQRLRYSGDAAGEFADALESMMETFLQYEMQKNLTAEEREYRAKIREEDRLHKDAWKEKEMEWEETKFQRNQWLQFHNNLYNTSLNLLATHSENYDKLLEEYEDAAGAVGDLTPIDVTTELATIMEIQTEDTLQEAQNDSQAIGALLQKIQARSIEIQDRQKLLNATGVYMVYNTDGSRSYGQEPMVNQGLIDSIWSPKDFEVMVNDLKNDTDFLTKVEDDFGVKVFDEDGMIDLPLWYEDYLDRLAATPDDKIASLNVDLMKVKSGELKLESDHYQKDIVKATWEANANPDNEWMRKLDSYVTDLDNLDKSYNFLPGFDHAYTNGLANAKQYFYNISESPEILNYATRDDVQKAVTKMMREDGYVGKDATPTTEQMGTYLQYKAEFQLAASDPVAMIVGTGTVKNVFASSKQSNMRYAGMLEDALNNTNKWVLGLAQGATDDERLAAQSMEYEWAQRLGMNGKAVSFAQYVNQNDLSSKEWRRKVLQSVNVFNTLIQPLIGEDGDLVDNPFMQIQRNVRKTQESIHDLVTSSPITSGVNANALNPNQNQSLDVTAQIASCQGLGGEWNGALGVCDTSGLGNASMDSTEYNQMEQDRYDLMKKIRSQGSVKDSGGTTGSLIPGIPDYNSTDTTEVIPDSLSLDDDWKESQSLIDSLNMDNYLNVDTTAVVDSTRVEERADVGDLEALINDPYAGLPGLDQDISMILYERNRPKEKEPYFVPPVADHTNVISGKSQYREEEEVRIHGHSSFSYDQGAHGQKLHH